MKQKNWLTRLFPHIIAVALFALLTVVSFFPVFQDNKVLYQSDIVQFKGVAKEITDYRAQTGQEPLWTNSMFGGMPAYQISTLFKGNLLRYVDDILTLGFPHPSELMFMLLLGFYILLISLDADVWLSIAGAIGFGFSSFNFILLSAGHNSEIHALSYIPICLAGILMVFRKKYLMGGVLSAIGLSLLIMANHLQIAYYFFLLTLVFIVIELIFSVRDKSYKHFITASSILGVAAVFAILTNLSLLWTTYEYGNETIRGKSELTSNKKSNGGLDEDYAFGWSYGKMETMTLLIPNVFGGSSNTELSTSSNTADALRKLNVPDEQISRVVQDEPTYWGEQPFTSGPVYLGAIFCFLFVLGCFLVKGPIKWWLLGASVLAILLSWGHNFLVFNDIMFKFFPGLNKFRTVTMALVIPQVTFPLMGILVLKQILNGEIEKAELLKFLKITLYIVGGLALITLVAGPSFANFKAQGDDETKSQLLHQLQGNQDAVNSLYNALLSDRASIMRSDAFRSLIFIGLIFGLLFYYNKGKIRKNIFSGALIILVIADLFFVGKRYLNNDDSRVFVDDTQYTQSFQPSQADQMIQRDQSLDYRVLNLLVSPFQDGTTSYFHKSMGGYSAAKLRRYQELIDHQIQPEINTLITALRSQKMDSINAALTHTPVLNMLNDKYVIINPNGAPLVNTMASGNAWFVSSYKIVPGADAEIDAIGNFDPKQTCFVDTRYADQLKGITQSDSSGSIKLQTYKPNDLVYQTSNKNEGIAVFSEIYYDKGWNAYVDGKETPYFRCNYVLRGMVIPAGDHKVEFKFEPKDYYTGETVAYISSFLLIIIGLGSIATSLRPAKKE